MGEMRLYFEGARRFVMAQRHQIALVLLEETLELLTVKYLSFDLLNACIVNSNAGGSAPAIICAITERLHFLQLELIRPIKGRVISISIR